MALVALAASTACGQDAADERPPEPRSSVMVTVVTTEGGEPQDATLECPGGDAAECAALGDLDLEALEPVPPDQACTLQFGGPETATVVGMIDGDPVDASFDRTNGCEIDRWTRVEPLLWALGLT